MGSVLGKQATRTGCSIANSLPLGVAGEIDGIFQQPNNFDILKLCDWIKS